GEGAPGGARILGRRRDLTSFRALPMVVALALAAGACRLAGQTSEPSTVVALRTQDGIRLDGDLREPAWQRAQRVSNFTQSELDFGAPATEKTEVAVVFDHDALYIGFWGYDSDPDGIRANEMARDFSWGADDNFEVVLDPFDDHRNGYLFVTNPNGARADALIAGGDRNEDWDGVWDVRTRRTAEGWFAEMRIPFSTLRFPPEGGRPWGINFERNIRRLRQQVLWQGWSRDYDLETLSRAGSLAGINGISGTRLAEARPYGIGGVEWAGAEGRSGVRSAGLDMAFLPVPSWKLQVTVRPDFAQVESDHEQVNLTRFSLFYPEKRTFFLEGSEFFAFDLGHDVEPFYSRRIGLAADRSEIPILGGVRVLGKSGATSLGAMALRTEAEGAEPATTFGVVRWKRDVLDESSVGILAVGRRDPGRTSATYGFDLRYATSALFGEREFAAGLSVAQTYDSGAETRYGLAHRLFVEYPNDFVEFSASWSRADSAFDPRVGYVRRVGFQLFDTELSFHPRPAFLPFVKQLEIKPFETSWYIDDHSGALQSMQTEVVPLAFTLKSGDDFELNFQRRADHPDVPFELFEGVEIPVGTYWTSRWEVQVESYRARPLSGQLEVNEGTFYGGRRLEATLSARWKAGRHVGLSGEYARNRITLGQSRFLVDEATARVDFAVSPRLFGALSGQWNNEDDEIIVNFRLNWIPEPGSDLYLVVNQSADTRDIFWVPTHTAVVSKLVWRIAM
ncbi:MAG: carbohydrate binding family 9 domain-containing protein, partial [Gemmatimonadetes bacterium]|nr:carbohydrate binding family 9 domain-containing protein [Gemmatimonadota bacterium]